MAQTLRYVEGLLANFPDNSQGLIDAVQMRDFVVSFINGRGFLVEDTDTALPILDGAWTSINPLLASPEVTTESLWVFDGNNFAFNAYASIPDTVIPVGYSKLLQIVAVLDLTKAAGGADNYEGQITRNGVGIGLAETITFPAAGGQTVTLLDASIATLDVTDTYGCQIQGVGTTDDLVLEYFTMQVSDSILLSDPTP
jgi:hypothetical protein